MEIPYYVLLILYGIGVATFLLWMGFNVYHLVKFGFFDFVGKMNFFIFLIFSLIIIVFTILFLWNVPWLDTFNPFNFQGILPLPASNNITL